MRRHGWQLPLHRLQLVGMVIFSFLVATFYVFLGPFLGNQVVENTVLSVFSFLVFSVVVLYIRCTWIDPSDKTNIKKRRGGAKCKGLSKINYKFVLYQVVVRFIRKVENKILKSCIRRRYLDPWNPIVQMEQPLLPFPLVGMDDAVAPYMKNEDITFCHLCDFEVKLHSKHCRTCDRCVDGFDHHCRWLNNCIGKKNYTTFILLMVSMLLMLAVEGGTAIAIFVRCFANNNGIEEELKKKLHAKFPKGILPAISTLLGLLSAYFFAALGQLFLFHVVLIRKGIRTYDYILAMREESESFDPLDDSDSDLSSDESIDLDSPEKPTLLSRFCCKGQGLNKSTRRLSITIVEESTPSTSDKKHEIQIDPWKLIKLSKEKALMAAERAREKIMRNPKPTIPPLKPLPLETKRGPLMMNPEGRRVTEITTPVLSNGVGLFSSPRRRFSGTPSPKPQLHKYRNNFDLKLTEVSRDLEAHITRQVLCSVLKKDGDAEASSR